MTSARTRGGGNYTFLCIDLKTKGRAILKLNLSGYLEALEKALPAMKSPKDIFYLDLDNKGRLAVIQSSMLAALIVKNPAKPHQESHSEL